MSRDHRNTSLKQLSDHFDRAEYVVQLKSCADKRTDMVTLQAIYERYFSPESSLQSRSGDGLTIEDLSQIMQYKLCRGKWRPRLQQLIESNAADACRKLTISALAGINDTRKDASKLSLEERMQILIQLKAVGPATASLILTIFDETIPFFGDELAAFLFPNGGKLKYDLKEYLALVKESQTWLDKQQADSDLQCSAKQLEEMVWFWARTGGSPAGLKSDSDLAKSDKDDKAIGSRKKHPVQPSEDEGPRRKLMRRTKEEA